VKHGHLGGVPPIVDLDHEMKLAELMSRLAETEQLAAAHDLSEGGLAQTLVEAICHSGLGAQILLPEGADPFTYLFSESSGRVLVVIPRGQELAVRTACEQRALPITPLGVTDANTDGLHLRDHFDIGRAELEASWKGRIGAQLGE
jgi:phosphoribosylformylglycinamidine synthase subunit PurL